MRTALRLFFFFPVIGLVLVTTAGCDLHSNGRASAADIDSGSVLAHRYCASCHAFPEPELLSDSVWMESILPNMGPRLGIFHHAGKFYPAVRNDPYLRRDYYPVKPVIDSADWQHILDYYNATAPARLAEPDRSAALVAGLPGFRAEPVAARGANPSTCFISADTFTHPHTLLISDVLARDLIRMDTGFRIVDSLSLSGPVLSAVAEQPTITFCNVGRINPTNGRFGTLQQFRRAAGALIAQPGFHIDSLARPVDIQEADFNGDGRTDYLICEFGYMTGALSWYEQTPGGDFRRHLIKPLPGAIRAYVRDIDQDGRPDIYVLFAQGEEGIFSFVNRGDGSFTERELLRFSPVRGSTSFELDDFNGDGYPDILYTAGDNADYSPVLKPYHGVYIFLGDGHGGFQQKYFYPVNGCFKAMARDFDGDGDLDIAAISFFADYITRPEEGFVFLENKGNLNFQARSLPGSEQGRWLTMDVDDFDGDGYPDIFLGNFSRAPSFLRSATDWTKGPAFLFLRNLTGRSGKTR